MNRIIRTAIIALSMLILLPLSGLAQMTALSESQMEAVTAQAGIRLQAEDLGIDLTAETIYYGDEDGVGGNSGAGYLSLNDVNLHGSIQWSSPTQIDVGTMRDPFGNTEITGVNISMTDMVIDVDEFSIGAIRVGSAPGEGKSFGSFGIKNMHAEISGNVKIWAH